MLAFALDALTGKSTQAVSADPESAGLVDIQVTLGFSNTFRLGRWAPVTVTLSNRGPDLVGQLEVEAPDGDEVQGSLFTTTHQRRLELPGDARKRFRFTVYLESFSRPLEIRVMSGERMVARRSLNLRRSFTSARLLLVLSRDADLDYLNDPREGSLRVLYPHPELLPDRWQGYDGVAAIVVHGVSLERLGAEQFEAIREWVARGGILAVSGGPDYTLLRTPRLAELLPGTPVGLVQVDDGAAVGAALRSPAFKPDPFDVNRVVDSEGRSLYRTAELPLVIEQARGRGRVVYLTFDVTREPFQRWIGMRQLWLDVLQLPPVESLTSHLVERRSESPVLDFVEIDSPAFPGRPTLFLFLGLYLAVLITGYREPFRWRVGRWVSPLMTWASPLAFAPVAYLVFGPLLFPEGASVFVASVIEPHAQGPYADLKLHVGWYANHRADLRLEYEGIEPVFRPVQVGAGPPSRRVDWMFLDRPRGSVQPASRDSYFLHVLEGKDVIPFDLRADLTVTDDGLALEVRNNSGGELADAWLVFEGGAYPLGSIAEDADWSRIVEPARDAIGFGAEPWHDVLWGSAGASDLEAVASARRLAHKVLERRGRSNPAPGRALLMGFARSPLRLSGDSVTWRRRELAMVLIESPVVFPARRGQGR